MRLPLRLIGPATLTVILALAAAPAGAEDEPVDPALAYRTKTTGLPAPTAAQGFRFTGVLRMGGKTIGYATLRAAPAQAAPAKAGEATAPAKGTPAAWLAEDRFVVKGKAVPSRESSTARLSRNLALIRGTSHSTVDGSLSWQRTSEGFAVRKGAEAADAEPLQARVFAHKGTALNTLAATVLFCRLALPSAGSYRTHIFEVEAGLKGKPAFEPVSITVLGEQELQGSKVLAVTAQKGAKEMTILFDVKTHAVRALRIVQGAQRLEILPADLWSMPAPDALTAGMRAMYGYSAGAVDVLDDVSHWPSLYKQALARATPEQRKDAADIEAWRTNMLAGFRKRLSKRNPAMMQALIQQMRSQVKQESLEGGRVRVTFPQMMRNMVFIVAPIEGVWHLVAQPSSPQPAAPKAK